MAQQVRPDEISRILRESLEQFETEIDVYDAGSVLQVGDGIARVHGLQNVMAAELLEFPGDVLGMALNLEEDNVGAVLFGDSAHVKEGDPVKRANRIVEVPVGEALLGRVVNPLGRPLDGKGPIETDLYLPVERKAPGIIDRQPVREPMQTGLKIVDGTTPVGRGQRELIIGDRQIGKTAICVDAIINQKESGVRCVYVAIGQKGSTVAKLVKALEDRGAMEYTTVISATASEPAPILWLAPYSGCAIAEYFRDNGMHSLVIYDDLTKHAWAYREMSLNLRRPAGREAYPGDVFYLHSRLLERAAKMSDEKGAGSMTALPIIETQEEDVTTYIPTNVWSITDGQIIMEPGLFYGGVRPAVNVGLSVSRLMGNAQTDAMKQVSGPLRAELARFREIQSFAQFGSEQLDASTQEQLRRGEQLTELLKQNQFEPLPHWKQLLSIFAGRQGLCDDIPTDEIRAFETAMHDHFEEHETGLVERIETGEKLSDEELDQIAAAIENCKKGFQAVAA
ncbi:MAG: F0F1 ATP synthase subunit alpha [Candidatus Poribacteria bacterium]|nr:F0F1 ATP synthase subunit alpha [Candidatus Poribacteria bacterium]